jgi:hypothetical protein
LNHPCVEWPVDELPGLSDDNSSFTLSSIASVRLTSSLQRTKFGTNSSLIDYRKLGKEFATSLPIWVFFSLKVLRFRTHLSELETLLPPEGDGAFPSHFCSFVITEFLELELGEV